MAKLTKRTVDATRPHGRETFVWDEDLPGFGLRVFASGKKSYLVQYKLGGRGGRTRRMSLGLHGSLRPTANCSIAPSTASEAEVARLADALVAMDREHRLNPSGAAAVRLLLLTGCRKSEILSLRWDCVDFERGLLRLADSKSGAKVVPLAAAAMELLGTLSRSSSYVLPAAKGSAHYTGLQKDWERVRVWAELPGLRLHDLRHSFASFAVADRHTLFMVGKVLGHKQARTTEGYAHLAADPVRAVANRTAARIAAAMKGGNFGAEIVPLPKHG